MCEGELKLAPVESFVSKVIQLHETTHVRHGLMLVGPASSLTLTVASVDRPNRDVRLQPDTPLARCSSSRVESGY